MLDGILEFILELILDGAAEATGSKAVPLPIRVIFAAFLILFYLAFFGLLIWVGISNDSVWFVIFIVVLMLFLTVGSCHKIRKLRKKN